MATCKASILPLCYVSDPAYCLEPCYLETILLTGSLEAFLSPSGFLWPQPQDTSSQCSVSSLEVIIFYFPSPFLLSYFVLVTVISN